MKHLVTPAARIRAMLPGIALVLLSGRLASAAEPIIVEVHETAGIRRFQYPMAVRLHLTDPVTSQTDFRLLLDNRPVLAQFRPAEQGDFVAGWWLDFPVDLLPYQASAYRVEYGAPSPAGPTAKRGHQLIESDALFQVVNEPAIAWSVDRKLAGLLRSVRSGDLEYLRRDSVGLVLTDRSGNEHVADGNRDGRQVTAQVIRNGPLAVGIRFELVEGNLELAGVRSTVDLAFPVFKSWVEVDWRIDDPQGKLAGLGARLDMNLSEPTRSLPALVDFGATNLVYVFLPPGQDAVLRSGPTSDGPQAANDGPPPAWEILRGPSDRLEPFVFGPRQFRADTRPEGWVHVMDRQRCLALAVDGFARDTTDQMSVSAAGAVRLSRQFPAGAPDSKTRAKQLRFWLHFIPFPLQQTAATGPQSMQTPPVTRIRVGQDQSNLKEQN